MSTITLIPSALKSLTRDGWILFLTRLVRLFAYGSLLVILVFYLIGLGLTESQVGLLLTLTLAGDIVASLFLTTRADRLGRRRMLVVGAILMAFFIAGALQIVCGLLLYKQFATARGNLVPSKNGGSKLSTGWFTKRGTDGPPSQVACAI